jgi:hypothetical protein
MTAPFVTSVTFDKPAYPQGAQATMTVVYGDADTKSQTIEFKVTDASGNEAKGFGSFVVDPLKIEVIDPSGRVWTKQSDTGTVAVYRATV